MTLFRDARAAVEAAAGDLPVHDPAFDVAASREAARAAAAHEPRPDVARVVDLDAGGVPVRAYVPDGALPGVVVHLHGGGFVLHDVEVHDASARRLAVATGTAVVSVDYRRPPEHRFPAAPDDASAVVAWLGSDAAREALGGPAVEGPWYAHGDSAGANLALVTALRHPGAFRAVALVYPFLDPEQAWPSYREAEGFDPAEAAWYWQQYAASPADLRHPDLAPLRSEVLGSLPPTLVVTAEHDPLRDEGEELARRLDAEGVAVVATRYLGQVHGFWRHPRTQAAATPLMAQVAGFLRSHR